MDTILREYKVTNALIGPDFRLTAVGTQILVQDCFAALMAKYHVAAFDLRLRSLMWIISEFSMDFTGIMPFWGDTVAVELWMSEIPSIKVHVDYRLSHAGKVFCKGDCIWAILEIDSRRPVNSLEILGNIPLNRELMLGTHRHHLEQACNEKYSFCHRINLSDTDFNSHVTNTTYMKVAKNAMPAGYIGCHRLAAMSMRFLHESFLDQVLTCKVSDTAAGDVWFYDITEESGIVCSRASIRFEPAVRCDCDLENLEIRKG